MCLLVLVFLHHWVSIHIRSYGRIKWHCWRYTAARSGYIFICDWQLVICSRAHLVGVCECVCARACECQYACMHTVTEINGKWRDFNSTWSTVCISHVAISICVFARARTSARDRETENSREWLLLNVGRSLISMIREERSQVKVADVELISGMQTWIIL